MTTNRNLLKEAIADARAVKETAIANAKAVLEEAFTPYLKEKLAAKLEEIDRMDDEKIEEVKGDIDENKSAEENGGELDLDALLKELDGLDNETEEVNENADLLNDPKTPDSAHGNLAEADDEKSEDKEEKDDDEKEENKDDEEIDIENMTPEDLEGFVKEVIASMVEDGSLQPGMGDEEDGAEGEEIEMGMDMGGEELGGEELDGGEEINIDELVSEIQKHKKKEEPKKEESKKVSDLEKELKEAYAALKTIKTELNEVNLFNAKLLYTNKIFRSKNLSENQKVKVLSAFDKAVSIKEAKLVYETLSEGLKQTKSSVNESLLRNSASKPAGVAVKKPILEVNNQFDRWQKLAGIKK